MCKVSKEPCILKYHYNKCKSQEMCKKNIDARPPLSKIVPD